MQVAGNESAAAHTEPDFVSVYCKACHKTHTVLPDEQECEPGAWLQAGEPWPTDSGAWDEEGKLRYRSDTTGAGGWPV